MKIKSNYTNEKLQQAMKDAWSGKTDAFVVDMGKGVTWLCTKGWPDGSIWWKYEKGQVFNMCSKTKKWILISGLSE